MTRSVMMRAALLLVGLLGSLLAPAQDVVARGQFGVLTRDNALALYEATAFCLEQVGQPQLLEGVSADQAIQGYAQAFPAADADTQAALGSARQQWQQTRQGWDAMSLADKRAFALDVLTLSFGDQAARQMLGIGSGGGSGSSDLGSMPSFDEGYEGSDCWGSAGCSDYSTDSGYTYDSYE